MKWVKSSALRKSFCLVSLSVLLLACGRDNSSEQAASPQAKAVLVGRFLDGPVAGLGYRSFAIPNEFNFTGLTNSNGEFQYRAGERIEFFIGAISLGAATARPVMTPLDLVVNSNIDTVAVVNRIRLLQSLDQDNNPNNGIVLNQNVRDAASNAVDFTNLNFAQNPVVLQLIADVKGTDATLVAEQAAKTHFRATLLGIGRLNTYLLGGQVFGLSGSLTLQLNDNGESLSISENGAFEFQNHLPEQFAYKVTLTQSPEGQTCQVRYGEGTLKSEVRTIVVSCVTVPDGLSVPVTVTGLNGRLVLQNNAADSLEFTADATQSFALPIPVGSGYAISVLTPPPTQTCSVDNGSATNVVSAIAPIQVRCETRLVSIIGSVNGLSGGELILQTLVSPEGTTRELRFQADAGFEFAIAAGAGYTITLVTAPASQVCSIRNGEALNVLNNVTDVAVTCSNINNQTFPIQVTVNGLSAAPGTSLLVGLDAQNTLAFTPASGNRLVFARSLTQSETFTVTINDQPNEVGQLCLMAGGGSSVSGQVDANQPASTQVVINCGFVIAVSVNNLSILAGTSLNVSMSAGAPVLTFTGGGQNPQAFATTVVGGNSYSVTIPPQPASTNSSQFCEIQGGQSATSITRQVVDADPATRQVIVSCTNRIRIADFYNRNSGAAVVTQECDTPLPNTLRPTCQLYPTTPIQGIIGGLQLCVEAEAARQGWTFIDQITALNCSATIGDIFRTSAIGDNGVGIDDPRDILQFKNLTSLDISNNRLRQMDVNIFSANLSFLRIAPNDRNPGLYINFPVTGLDPANAIVDFQTRIKVVEGEDNQDLNANIYSDDDVTITCTDGVGGVRDCSIANSNIWGYDLAFSLRDQPMGQTCAITPSQILRFTHLDTNFPTGTLYNGSKGASAINCHYNADVTAVTDPQLKRCLQDRIVAVNAQTVADVTLLNCANQGITSLAGLESFTALEYLDLRNNSSISGGSGILGANGVAQLSGLANLRFVDLTGNTELTPADVTTALSPATHLQLTHTAVSALTDPTYVKTLTVNQTVAAGASASFVVDFSEVASDVVVKDGFNIGFTTNPVSSGIVGLALISPRGTRVDINGVDSNGIFKPVPFPVSFWPTGFLNEPLNDSAAGGRWTVAVDNSASTSALNLQDITIKNCTVANCPLRNLIRDLAYLECSTLPNGSTTLCGKPAFQACVETEASTRNWIYADEVTALNCSNRGIDDPRDVSLFPNLNNLEIGNNPLNQISFSLFSSRNWAYINVAPNSRFPSISFTFTAVGLLPANLTAFQDALRVTERVTSLDVTNDLNIFYDGNIGGNSERFLANGTVWGYDLKVGLSTQPPGQNCPEVVIGRTGATSNYDIEIFCATTPP